MNEDTTQSPQQPRKTHKTISLKPWQILVAAIAVVAITIACTVTVTMVARDGKARNEAAKSYIKPQTDNTNNDEDTSESQKSKRGNLIKHIGDTASTCADTSCSTLLTQWKVTNITLDFQCPVSDYAYNDGKPENGHFVAFDFEAETSADNGDGKDHSIYLGNSGPWTYFTKDGTQWNGNVKSMSAQMCIPDDQRFPSTVQPGSKASGKIVFDVPSTDGVLAFTLGVGGWEYPLE